MTPAPETAAEGDQAPQRITADKQRFQGHRLTWPQTLARVLVWAVWVFALIVFSP
jgi:hypothetical protein